MEVMIDGGNEQNGYVMMDDFERNGFSEIGTAAPVTTARPTAGRSVDDEGDHDEWW